MVNLGACRSSFGVFTKDDIAQLESRVLGKLPDDYKNIVMTYGALFFEEICEFEGQWKRIDGKPISIEEDEDLETEFGTYGFNRQDGIHEALNSFHEYGDSSVNIIPKFYFPFGADVYGAHLLIDLSPDHYGSIWLWSLSIDPWGKEENVYIAYIAPNIEQFVKIISASAAL